MAIGNGDSDKADSIQRLEYDPLNPIMVNECNGVQDPNTHSILCNELCDRRALDELDIAIWNEEQEWAAIGMNPNNMTVDPINMNIQLQSMRRLLIDTGVVSESDLDDEYRKFRLENMQRLRLAHGDRVKQNRLKRMIAPVQQPPLIDPKTGKPFREG